MPVRDVVRIDEELCNGCGDCVPSCAEGAIAVIDGKARLVSEVYCDGLGACLGHCPQGAISVVRREAVAFDEHAVQEHLGRVPAERSKRHAPIRPAGGACPGSRVQAFSPVAAGPRGNAPEESRLSQWPIQLHLLPPSAPFLQGSDLLLAADCVAFSVGGFQSRFLEGHSLAIACPKLDGGQDAYLEKLVAMIDEACLRSITVTVMEVPCCSGLVRLAQQAAARAQRSIPIHVRVVSVRGQVLLEQEIGAA